MKRKINFLFLLLLINIYPNCQTVSKVIIWKPYKNEVIYNKNIEDFNKFINDSLIKILIKKDVYLIYYGNKIINPYKYKLPKYSFGVSLDGDDGYSFDSFICYNDTLDSFEQYTDSFCVSRKDSLADGKWMRSISDSKGVYMQAEKNIKNGLLNGIFEKWFDNRVLWCKEYYKDGFLVDTSYLFNENSCLIDKTIYLNDCNIIKEIISYDSSSEFFQYYNINLGYFIKIENGIIMNISKINKYLSNDGKEFNYDEKGELIEIVEWKNGKRIKK